MRSFSTAREFAARSEAGVRRGRALYSPASAGEACRLPVPAAPAGPRIDGLLAAPTPVFRCAVAENGSVSRAARYPLISQSTVTEAIRELELDLGFQLLDRHARGVDLTLKGHQFLRHARQNPRPMSPMPAVRWEWRGEALSGQLSLGVTPLVASYVLSDLLARFRRAFPPSRSSVVEDSGGLSRASAGRRRTRRRRHGAAAAARPARRCRPRRSRPRPIASGCRSAIPLTAAERVSIARSRRRAACAAGRRRDRRSPGRSLGGGSASGRRSPSAPARSRRSAASSRPGAGVAILPDLTYRPWSLEGDKIEARAPRGRPAGRRGRHLSGGAAPALPRPPRIRRRSPQTRPHRRGGAAECHRSHR